MSATFQVLTPFGYRIFNNLNASKNDLLFQCAGQAAILPSWSARAKIIPSEFLIELLVPVDDSDASFHAGLGRESAPAFAHRFEKNGSSSKLAVDMTHRPFWS